jgi:fructokinase
MITSFFRRKRFGFFSRANTPQDEFTQEHDMADVICMGELLAEFVAQKENVSLEDAPGFVKAPGGAPANVAVALRRLGASSAFIGKVGNDPFGRFLRRSLEADGVDTRFLMTDPQARTTAVYVTVWDDGHKDLCFYRNPGADMLLRPDEIDAGMFAEARAFHFGSIGFIDEPCASAQRKALELARRGGLMISYDPNYRPTLWPSESQARKVIQDSFNYCHLAKVSQEEWEVASGHSDLEAGIRALLGQGVELLVISRGEGGSLAVTPDYRIELPAFPVEVVETTGAGDGFMAAMITRLLPEREKAGSLRRVEAGTVRAALNFANAVGALTCTRMGAIPALPTLKEVNAFLVSQKD